jgi:hypothetical protein
MATNKWVTSRASRFVGFSVLILYLLLAVAYGLLAPPFESPDEVGHFFTIKYIADHGRLPLPEKALSEQYLYGQEGTQPPLYYLGGALFLRLSRVYTEDVWGYLHVNPHTTCGSPHLTGNKGFLAHDPVREAFPWQDSLLALHLLRLYSTALGLATVIGVYATGRLCFPDRPIVAPLAAALTALNPQFLFVSAGVNNDNLIVPLCVWSLYLMLRAIHRGLTPATSALTGLLIGLAALTKMAGLLLLPLASLTVLLSTLIDHLRAPEKQALSTLHSPFSILHSLFSTLRAQFSSIVSHSACILLPTLAVAGWWYARNALLYADPTLIEHHLVIVSRRDPTPLPLILHEVPSIFYSYWGRFSCDLTPGGWYYTLWGLVTLAGLGGLIAGWREFTLRRRAALFLLAGWFLLVFAGWFRWNLIASGVQGRLIFPATVSVSVLVGGGLAAWVKHRAWAGPVLVLACVALALWVLLGLIRPAYAPPPRYPDVQGLEIPNRMDGVFGDRIALLGYDVRPADLEPGQGGKSSLEVTLYLSALRPLTDTYSMGLWLVSAMPGDTTRLAGLDTWPGDGNYPTLVWQPGEIIVDTYRLKIPDDVPRAQAWMVQLNIYRMGEGWFPFALSGERVGDRAILEWVRVGASEPPQVPPEARLERSPVFGTAIALQGARINLEEQGLQVLLWWEALAPLEGDYTVFVHLVDEGERQVSTGDGPPLEGGFPTRLWRPGDSVADGHVIPLPPDLPPGVYAVRVGWYDLKTGVRLPAMREGQRLPQDAVTVDTWSRP